MGHILISPDNREFRFALNDGTAEVAGNLYQSVAPVAGHTNRGADVARAIDATVVSATLVTTAATIDIYAEGVVHINNDTGQGYAYRIRRAINAGDAHAASVASGVLTVNLEPGEQVQVAIDTTTELTFTRNRYHQVLLMLSPPTAGLAGVSPGVCAADRYYWSQVKGYAAVLADTTLLAGLPVQASITVDGAVEPTRRRLQFGGSTALVVTVSLTYAYLVDSGGTTTGLAILSNTTQTSVGVDVTGGLAYNAPTVGQCIKANADTDYALVDLLIPA